MNGPTQQLDTLYTFVDKQRVEAEFQAGRITQQEYSTIIEVLAGYGLNYANFGNRHEQLQIGNLSNWSF